MDHRLATSEFWKENVEVGMFITINDAAEILESGKLEGTDYTVKFVRTFRDNDKLGEWIFFYLEPNVVGPDDAPVWLLVKSVGEEIDFRVYYARYEDEFFKEGNRADILEWDQNWIFAEPDDVENFNVGDLKYSNFIVLPKDTGEEVEYLQKAFGEIYGEISENPEQVVQGSTPTTLVEYSSNDEDSPEILILEIGEEEDGGLISLLVGNPVGVQDLEVMA